MSRKKKARQWLERYVAGEMPRDPAQLRDVPAQPNAPPKRPPYAGKPTTVTIYLTEADEHALIDLAKTLALSVPALVGRLVRDRLVRDRLVRDRLPRES